MGDLRHIHGTRSVSIILGDGRCFTAPTGYPDSEFCWRLRFTDPSHTDGVNAAAIIDTFKHLLEADRKEADKQLGHLRAAYRASKKWSPDQ